MKTFTVFEATKHIKSLLDKDALLNSIAIRGEISNFKHHTSGHCYFTLKDSLATIRVVMFKSRFQYVKFSPVNGMKVVAVGNVTLFERDGQYQLYTELLIPDGIGELSIAFEQLKEKLTAEGLFNEEHKKKIPLLPRSIGIVTSSTGAALRDIITVAKRRCAGAQLILYPVQVQGAEAPAQIVQAINAFNRLGEADVLIVGRGGGSIEELWAFNDEKVVRAIAASTIPIISAVGHQTDYTLADFTADVRAATPSQAAEIAVPDYRELQRYVERLQKTLITSSLDKIQKERLRLNNNLHRRALQFPMELLSGKQQTLDNLNFRLTQAITKIVELQKREFATQAGKLASLNPLAVISRGFSIVRSLDGQTITNINDVEIGQYLEIILREGLLKVEVCNIKGDKYGKKQE